jgi:8-oxo-dGTP pyrophosphatase MutT (NUDIX family)
MKIQALQRLMAGRETGEGAGALFYCLDTENFLILLRADDGDDGNVWCCLGGGRDNVNGVPEDLETTVRREAFEEAGLPMDHPMELIHVGTKYYEDGFRFHNYLGLVKEEFLPIINEEHKSFQWVPWHEFPKEMHRGMMSVFNSPEGQAALKHYTTALDHY